jgi:hypothetical protein
MYHLRLGEPLLAGLVPRTGPAAGLQARKVWLGGRREADGDSLEFRVWLLERGLADDAFQQWVGDKLPAKPFFPLKSDQFGAKVIMLIRENPKSDGALVRITEEGRMKDDLVVFERDDFYLCGVHVGEADMRFLLRPGDSVTVQPTGLSERERKVKAKKFPKLAEFEFRPGSLLAYLGDSRPRGPNTRPEASVELRQFLEGKGMSVDEFAAMRGGQDELPCGEPEGKESSPAVPGTAPDMFPNFPMPMPMPMPMHMPMPGMQLPQDKAMGIISTLCTRAILCSGETDLRVAELLQTGEEVEQALRMAK